MDREMSVLIVEEEGQSSNPDYLGQAGRVTAYRAI